MKIKKLKKYRRIFITLGLIALVVVMVSVRKSYRNTICKDLIVTVLDSADAKYITQSSVISYLLQNIETDIEGNYFKNIDISNIENLMKMHPYVKTVEVYRAGSQVIQIKVTQRKPFIRIFDDKNFSFYVDKEGYILPLSKTYASYVSVFTGNIPHYDSLFNSNQVYNIDNEIFDTSNYQLIYDLAKKIDQDEFMLSLIDQVNVLPNNEFEMIPKVGNCKILFGTIDSAETKFENLLAFYQQAAPKVGWDLYSQINLKYLNQVVCTKK